MYLALFVLTRWLDEQKAKLVPNIIPVDCPDGRKYIKFNHKKIKKSMTDGKVKAAATETKSTLKCFLCKATPTAFNKLDDFPAKFQTDQQALLEFGAISNMHAWERSFDALNHLSDKLSVNKWRVTGQENKDKVKRCKAVRQEQMDDAFGLKVNVPHSSGS